MLRTIGIINRPDGMRAIKYVLRLALEYHVKVAVITKVNVRWLVSL